MTVAWLVYTLLVGALAGLGALATEAACRVSRRPTRWAWAWALGLTVALAGAAPWRRPAPGLAVPVALAAPGRLVSISARAPVPPAMVAGLLGVWAATSLVLLGAALGATARLHRQMAAWPVVWIDGAPVRLSPHVGPAAVGIARPEVVAPTWLLACTPEEQHAVLAHEREHVRAHDPGLLAAARLVAVLLPWHPVVWWMFARLRLAVEIDCDRRVLHRGATPAQYGGALLTLAARITDAAAPSYGPRVLGGVALVTRPRDLERRLVALTARRARHPRVQAAASLTAALVAVLAACTSRIPTATREPPPSRVVRAARPAAREGPAVADTQGPAASAVRRHTRMAVRPQGARASTERRPPLVFIDGQRADTAALARLSRAEIASVEVLKAARARRAYPDEADAAHGVVRITTRAAHATR